ncbi:NUDIX hydrolase [Candidatus Uhrbacteria bacterium]|nr:NUDIX hydrolase [Candidatus Uhrbacteria bacterium]
MKINSNIDIKIEGQYCLKCNSAKVERVFKDGKTYYFCKSCGATEERSLVIDNAVNWWIDEDKNYWHESTGAIILNEKGEWLVVMRATFPFAYALPAGHVDKGEDALIAVRRELMEEIGLELPKEDFKFVKEFHLPGDSCRRGSDHHLWHLYLVKINSEKENLRLNDEASSFRWLKPEEIKTRNDIVYPLKYILENIEI